MVSHPEFPVRYRIVKKASGALQTEIEWTGAFWFGGVPLDSNVNTVVIPSGGLPTTVRPAASKYYTVNAGNTSSNYAMARLLIGNDGRLEYKKYGNSAVDGSDENRIELTGIKYNLEVTG
jgi:hypothetical protein